MKLARRALDDPSRLADLRDQLDLHLSELLAEATDAGYSTREVLDALNGLCARQQLEFGWCLHDRLRLLRVQRSDEAPGSTP